MVDQPKQNDPAQETSGEEKEDHPKESANGRMKQEDIERYIQQAANRSDEEYRKQRVGLAKHLSMSVNKLDKEVRKLKVHKQRNASSGHEYGFEILSPEPWHLPVNGSELLDELTGVFQRYLDLPHLVAETLALWVVFTHTFDAWDNSPRLGICSPVPGCGKTTLLSLLSFVACKPVLASSVTPAVIFRTIEAYQPTLLIDEADTFLDDNSGFKGILNSGHNRHAAYVMRCDGDDSHPRKFLTWAPLAIARIGTFNQTLRERSIIVNMRKHRPGGNSIERFQQDQTDELETVCSKAARWANDTLDELSHADPHMPKLSADREADNWRPLIAIADAAGGQWPDIARSAAIELTRLKSEDNSSTVIQLLEDIRAIFEVSNECQFSSQSICNRLASMEERPWGDWRYGKEINPLHLARLLKPFGIRPVGIRANEKTLRGYKLDQFEDTFFRYL
jgi:putative DNA primase/helicase